MATAYRETAGQNITARPRIGDELVDGTEVYYTGDMANCEGSGRVVRLIENNGFGARVVVELDAEGNVEAREMTLHATSFATGPGQRFFLLSEWDAYQEAKAVEGRKRMEAAIVARADREAAKPADAAGAKYDGDRNLRDTAKLIRVDIKAAQRFGSLPRGKYSVRIERFSMGQAIRVSLEELSQPTLIVNPDRVRAQADSPHGHVNELRHSEPGREILATLADILAQYNHDFSDKYSHFYTTVSFSMDLEEQQKAHVLSFDRGLTITARRWAA